MKKRLFPALLALVLALTMLPMGVFAADATDGKLPDAVDNVITLTKNVTLTATHEVAADANVVIDLAGFKITAPAEKKAIEVKPGGTLEIKDSSAAKTGEVTRTDGKNVYVIQNSGTMTLSGGTISSAAQSATTLANRSADASKTAKLTINGGTVKGDYIAIKNDRTANGNAEPELIIEDGIIASGKDQVIQNWGTATIKNGKFSGCVGTWTDGANEIGKTTIEGGSFDLDGSTIVPSAVLALFQYNDKAVKGELKITGDITVDTTLPQGVQGNKPAPKAVGVAVMAQGGNQPVDKTPQGLEVVVSAGTYSAPVDPQYLADTLKFQAKDGNGNYSYHADQRAAETAAGTGGSIAQITDAGKVEPIIKIKATGFIWDVDDKAKIAEAKAAGVTTTDDWVDQTIWVAFDQALPVDTHYWFDVEINGTTYGIAANGDGTHAAQAFSFLNLGQWENAPSDLADAGTGLKDGVTVSAVQVTVYKSADDLSNKTPTDDQRKAFEAVDTPKTVTVPAKPTNANPNLKTENVKSDYQNYAKVKISGMLTDGKAVYMIRLAPSTGKDANSVILIIDQSKISKDGTYELYCKVGQNLSVDEFTDQTALQGTQNPTTGLWESSSSSYVDHTAALGA